MAARSQIQRYPASDSTLSMQSVRRNLFNSQLSRRPTRSDSTTSSSRTVIDYPQDQTSNSDSSSEILIKNANGDYAATIPSISFLVTDSNEAAVVDEQCDQLEDDHHLMELLRTRTRHSNEQELLDAVRINLRRKVEALADDKWMFEGGK